jgi:uncharacterized cupin superfamily protein
MFCGRIIFCGRAKIQTCMHEAVVIAECVTAQNIPLRNLEFGRLAEMTIETSFRLGNDPAKFVPSPIKADWVIEGTPVARIEFLSGSEDGAASSYFWDCTAGRFHWFYTFDETLFILEGSATLKGPDGRSQTVVAGDTVFFPTGTRSEWTVKDYVRKLAFCRAPLPGVLVRAKRIVGWVKRGGRAAPANGGGLL